MRGSKDLLSMIKLLHVLIFLCPMMSLRAQIKPVHAHHFEDSLYAQHFLNLDSIITSSANGYTELKTTYDSLIQDYNTTTTRLQNRIDSLKALSLPTDHIAQKLDSIHKSWRYKSSAINGEFERIKESTKQRIDQMNLPPELNRNVQEYTTALDKLDLSVPSSDFQMPALNIDKGNLAIPGLDSPVLDGLPDVSAVIVPKVNGIAQGFTGVKDLKQSIPKDITNVDQLAKVAENQVNQISQVAAVQEQLRSLPTSQMLSPEQTKEKLLQMARETAVDHFAGKESELKAAMELVSKYKKKFISFNSLEELTRKRPNEMQGKLLIERIIPGIAMQIQKKNDELMVDFNPYVGYRFTGKISAGLGWNQRVSYKMDNGTFNNDARIYGPRMYGEYKLGLGFSPRAEVELMNTYIPPFARPTGADLRERQWVCGVFVGMKKDYKFFKKINGTAQVMFRLFDSNNKSPYADVINARFGFEFPMKKKKKTKQGN